MFTEVILDGFKSFRSRQEIELRQLTVLAGANGAGKSSAMQPLLLLKQSYDVSYDPGALLISGPNVEFSRATQMLWSAPGQRPRDEFALGFRYSQGTRKVGIEVRYKLTSQGLSPLEIMECATLVDGATHRLRPEMSQAELEAHVGLATRTSTEDMLKSLKPSPVGISTGLLRKRSLLTVAMSAKGPTDAVIEVLLLPSPLDIYYMERALTSLIHVPALRGNPRRTYPMTAVGRTFPGVFNDYVASIVAAWTSDGSEKLRQLGTSLARLGLTWKVRAAKVDDAKVEITVGRLPRSRRGGGRDLVNVADVGFAVGQVLPVAVALLVADGHSCVYLEQPEIHLHPRAQLALAEIIAEAVLRGNQVIVETHSELLLLGLQRLVAAKSLPAQDVLLHWFTRDDAGATSVTSVTLDEAGTFGDWPVDFADVSMEAMRKFVESSLRAGGSAHAAITDRD